MKNLKQKSVGDAEIEERKQLSPLKSSSCEETRVVGKKKKQMTWCPMDWSLREKGKKHPFISCWHSLRFFRESNYEEHNNRKTNERKRESRRMFRFLQTTANLTTFQFCMWCSTWNAEKFDTRLVPLEWRSFWMTGQWIVYRKVRTKTRNEWIFSCHFYRIVCHFE